MMHESNHQLQATLQALGYLEDGKYYKSKDCLNATKDIIRFLRHDDEHMKSIRIELLESDVLTNDLMPLLKSLETKKDEQLFDIVLRLLVNLTQSAITCYDRKIPTDKIELNVYMNIDSYLQKAKDSFADEVFVKVLDTKLNEILSKDWKNRPEEEELCIERILFLIRNMLMIKAGTDDDGNNETCNLNSHDMFICALDKSGVLDTLTKLSSSTHEPKYMIHLLEIMTYVLRERSAKELGQLKETNQYKRSQVEKDEDNDELFKLQIKDKQIRQHNRFNLSTRHSRFAGTYVATNVKSISDQHNQICHKQLPYIKDLFDDSEKKHTRKGKNRIAVEEEDKQVRSNGFVKVVLMKFCKNFFKNSYNSYMCYLNDMMQRKKLEDDEICSYYWLIKFFMEFNRNTDELKLIKLERMRQTFSLEMLHSIEIYITRCIEMLMIEKHDTSIWIKRMHTCLNCYKEYLITLKSFEKNSNVNADATNLIAAVADSNTDATNNFDCLNEEANELITRMKNQIFYIQEFRELFINIMKDFNESKTTKNFLKDVIEANHIFLEMLETYLNENNEVNVQKKTKARRKSKTAKNKAKKPKKLTKEAFETQLKAEIEEKFNLFEKIEDNLVELLVKNKETLKSENEENETDLFQLDFATSDTEIDSQKDKAMKKIQNFIKKNQLTSAILLFREAKYLWPNEKDLFGDDTMTSNEEYEKIKEIFMRHFDENEEANENEIEHENDDVVHELNDEDDRFDAYGSDENEDEQHESYSVKEERLDFVKFFVRYTHSRIIKSYIYVLGDYAVNTDFQNNCILKFFERIVNQCDLPQYLYQLSLFNLIDIMYKDPLRKCLETSIQSTTSIFVFFRKLLEKFFDDLNKNRKLLLEVLFLKDKKLVFELNEGYGAVESSKPKEPKKSKKDSKKDSKKSKKTQKHVSDEIIDDAILNDESDESDKHDEDKDDDEIETSDNNDENGGEENNKKLRKTKINQDIIKKHSKKLNKTKKHANKDDDEAKSETTDGDEENEKSVASDDNTDEVDETTSKSNTKEQTNIGNYSSEDDKSADDAESGIYSNKLKKIQKNVNKEDDIEISVEVNVKKNLKKPKKTAKNISLDDDEYYDYSDSDENSKKLKDIQNRVNEDDDHEDSDENNLNQDSNKIKKNQMFVNDEDDENLENVNRPTKRQRLIVDSDSE